MSYAYRYTVRTVPPMMSIVESPTFETFEAAASLLCETFGIEKIAPWEATYDRPRVTSWLCVNPAVKTHKMFIDSERI